MVTTTSRLGLNKPDTSDLVDIAVLNQNADKLDAAAGATICTSSTRPTAPFNGQIIFETNTNSTLVYKAATSSWTILGGVYICTSGTRPGLPYEGQQILETDTKKEYTYVSGAWQPTVSTTVLSGFDTVANAAARDALYPSPVQGNRVFLSDLGIEQTYYGLYNAGTNPGGRPAAGWYASQRNVGLVPVTPVTVANTGGSYVKNGGMITFSGVTSISLNGVFSSAYKNYRLVLSDLISGLSNTSIVLRMRNGGTDNSSNTYYQLWTMKRLNGTFQDNTGGPATSYTLIGFDTNTTYSWHWSGDVISPFDARNTTFSGQGFGVDASGAYMLNSTVLHGTNSSFDGITFYTSTGTTMSGNIQILGYNY